MVTGVTGSFQSIIKEFMLNSLRLNFQQTTASYMEAISITRMNRTVLSQPPLSVLYLTTPSGEMSNLMIPHMWPSQNSLRLKMSINWV